MTVFRFATFLGLLVGTLMLLGCQSPTTEARKREGSHLRSLISIYNFANAKLGHRPANEAEFKAFITAHANTTIDPLHLGSVDELFLSERDHQPFVVLYSEPPAGAAHDLVAYEQTGVAGKRLVGYSLGVIEKVDEQRFAELVPAK